MLSARPRILAHALRRAHSTEDAADVVAETLAIAWKRLGDVPEGDGALLWHYVTARHVLRNESRRARRGTPVVGARGPRGKGHLAMWSLCDCPDGLTPRTRGYASCTGEARGPDALRRLRDRKSA